MANNEFDFDAFLNNITEKVSSQSFEQNLDMALALCMKDFYNYRSYCLENNVSAEQFEVCTDAFTAILFNRYNLEELDCGKYIENCENLLDELQEDENDYFDECVNTTCEIIHIMMYISTRDTRNITEVVKLCFESAEAFLQRNDEDESSYELNIAKVSECLKRLDISSLTEIHNFIKNQ